VLYVERGGRGMMVLACGNDLRPDYGDDRIEPALAALAAFVTSDRRNRLSLERIDGLPAAQSPLCERLVDAGFRRGPRKLTLSA